MKAGKIIAAIGDGIGAAGGGGGLNESNLTASSLVATVLSWMTWIVGAISVVFIIIGGIRYVTSGGDAEKVKKAKNTVLYACIGLGVAILSFAIARFVESTLQNGVSGGPSTIFLGF